MQLLQDAFATGDDGTHLEADATGQRQTQWGAGLQQVAGALDLELHEQAPGAVAAAFGDLAFVDAVFAHLVLREVDAVFFVIDRHVLQEIDDLQRGTDGIRHADVARRSLAVEVQQQAADRIGRAAAIIHDFAEIGVAGLGHVLAEGVEQVIEGLQRQLMLADGVLKADEECSFRTGLVSDSIKLLTKTIQ